MANWRMEGYESLVLFSNKVSIEPITPSKVVVLSVGGVKSRAAAGANDDQSLGS